jgi:hypothetical protein
MIQNLPSLLGDVVVNELKKKHKRFGYFHWVQLQLGEGLIREGIKEAKDECFAAVDPNAESTPTPHFMPSCKRLRRESLQVLPVPEKHELVPIKDIKLYDDNRNFIGTLPQNRCEGCKCKPRVMRNKGIYKMPNGKPCPRPRKGCSKCKVCLCKTCFRDIYDHEKNQVRPSTVVVT